MAETVESTAFGPMVIIALEQTFPQSQCILDDPMARQMLPAYAKVMVNLAAVKPIRQALFSSMEKPAPGVYAEMVCRKRYIQDKVLEASSLGIETLVILGAGLDTLAYRPLLSSVRAYEVDLPGNVAYKRQKLEAIYGSVPSRVSLIATDFERQTLDETLKQAGYAFDQRSFFVWEGVTQYLTESAVRDTFRVLAKAVPGSRLVFTYVLKDFIDGKNMHGSESLYQRFRVKSQTWKFGIDPQQVEGFLQEYGWKLLEQVGAPQFSDRYLKPTGRQMVIADIEPAVYAEKLP